MKATSYLSPGAGGRRAWLTHQDAGLQPVMDEIDPGLMPVDGLRLALFNGYGRLDYCEDYRSPGTQPAKRTFG